MTNSTDKYIVSYAQNQEDIILAGFLKAVQKGFYVDIGAHDPVHDSVTKYFYERGWSGVNVEPINKFYRLLEADRPRDINLNVGIGVKKDKLIFREYHSEAGEGMSTFSQDMSRRYEENRHWATQDFTEYAVDLLPLRDVLASNNVETIDFMKIDVEGLEYEVLLSNDWNKYRPKVLCIEANHIIKNWRPLLQKQHYKIIYNDGLNDYFIDTKQRDLPNFSYPEDILMNPVEVLPWRRYIRERSQVRQVKYLSDTLASYENVKEGTTTTKAVQPSIKVYVKDFIIGFARNMDAKLTDKSKDFDVAHMGGSVQEAAISEHMRRFLITTTKRNPLIALLSPVYRLVGRPAGRLLMKVKKAL